jgi:hypothetical protein
MIIRVHYYIRVYFYYYTLCRVTNVILSENTVILKHLILCLRNTIGLYYHFIIVIVTFDGISSNNYIHIIIKMFKRRCV